MRSSLSYLASNQPLVGNKSTVAVQAHRASTGSRPGGAPTTGTTSNLPPSASEQSSSVRVFVRVRPFNDREREGGSVREVVRVDESDPSHITVLDPKFDYRPKETHAFERCFFVPNSESPAAVAAAQQEVYEQVGRNVLTTVVSGFNGCVFAYGQTGSGKTFTMFGCEMAQSSASATPLATAAPLLRSASTSSALTDANRRSSTVGTPRAIGSSSAVVGTSANLPTTATSLANSHSDPSANVVWTEELRGIIPRVIEELFVTLNHKQQEDTSASFRVELQYFEIYNEKVLDLVNLSNKQELRVRQDPIKGPFVEHLTTTVVEHTQQISQILKKGALERRTAATRMNERSSRSHAILSLTLIQIRLDENDCAQRVTSKLNLVDLAGSERTGLTGAEGQRFAEATKINLSLTTLGRVIDCLADQSTGRASFSHCPYRESNLTWLLMDSLGGNSKTTMVATISPSALALDEIVQTLRYASRARQIVNTVIVNEDPHAKKVKELMNEIDRLSKIIAQADLCTYNKEYVEELEAAVQQQRVQLETARAANAHLRCEMEALQHTQVPGAGAPATRVKSAVRDVSRSSTSGASTTCVAAPKDQPAFVAQSRVESSTEGMTRPALQEQGVHGAPSHFSRQECQTSHLLQDSTEALTQQVNHLGAEVTQLSAERRALLSQLKHAMSENASIGASATELERTTQLLLDRIDSDERVIADYVHRVESMATLLHAKDALLESGLRTARDDILQAAACLGDAVTRAEREQREILEKAAGVAKSDLRTLILQHNAATEKRIASKVKDEMAKKHTAALASVDEAWEARLAEAKLAFAKQMADERSQHESAVQTLVARHAEEVRELRSAAQTNDAANEYAKREEGLREELGALQKRCERLAVAHEREKQLLLGQLHNDKQQATLARQVAVADAVAKSKASLEQATAQEQAAKKECGNLSRRLAAAVDKIAELENTIRANAERAHAREQHWQDWRQQIQTAHTLILNEEKGRVTCAESQRAASHERHEHDRGRAEEAIRVLDVQFRAWLQHSFAAYADACESVKRQQFQWSCDELQRHSEEELQRQAQLGEQAAIRAYQRAAATTATSLQLQVDEAEQRRLVCEEQAGARARIVSQHLAQGLRRTLGDQQAAVDHQNVVITQANLSMQRFLREEQAVLHEELARVSNTTDTLIASLAHTVRQWRWHQEVALNEAKQCLLDDIAATKAEMVDSHTHSLRAFRAVWDEHACAAVLREEALLRDLTASNEQSVRTAVMDAARLDRVYCFGNLAHHTIAAHQDALQRHGLAASNLFQDATLGVIAAMLSAVLEARDRKNAVEQQLAEATNELQREAEQRRNGELHIEQVEARERQREWDLLEKLREEQTAHTASESERIRLVTLIDELEMKLGEANLDALEAEIKLAHENDHKPQTYLANLIKKIWTSGSSKPANTTGASLGAGQAKLGDESVVQKAAASNSKPGTPPPSLLASPMRPFGTPNQPPVIGTRSSSSMATPRAGSLRLEGFLRAGTVVTPAAGGAAGISQASATPRRHHH